MITRGDIARRYRVTISRRNRDVLVADSLVRERVVGNNGSSNTCRRNTQSKRAPTRPGVRYFRVYSSPPALPHGVGGFGALPARRLLATRTPRPRARSCKW
jgi:hypothetical protein